MFLTPPVHSQGKRQTHPEKYMFTYTIDDLWYLWFGSLLEQVTDDGSASAL